MYERTNYVAMSIGITDNDRNKFDRVYANADGNIKFVCVDVANGYSERFADFIRKLRTDYPNIVIIAGNVVTGEMTEELILAGADIIKVGIGPGSVCTTRIQTGVGYPQLSAVMECADAAHGLGGHIIADGGCTTPGDVAKAFAGGADFVMLGGMLAGHDEGGGDVITKIYETSEVKKTDDGFFESVYQEKQFVQFYGMSSKAANNKHFGGLKEYRSSEGREVLVPYRGSVARTIQDILGGVRSTCTYAGAVRLKHLNKCTTFVRCTQTHNSVYEKNTIGN
jgi:GMP reductase